MQTLPVQFGPGAGAAVHAVHFRLTPQLYEALKAATSSGANASISFQGGETATNVCCDIPESLIGVGSLFSCATVKHTAFCVVQVIKVGQQEFNFAAVDEVHCDLIDIPADFKTGNCVEVGQVKQKIIVQVKSILCCRF